MPSVNRKNWHSADVVAAVRKKGSSLVNISESLGLTRSAASRALIFPHPRVNVAIAGIIGQPLNAIWPQWFDAKGKRIPLNKPAPNARSTPAAQFPTSRVSESNLSSLSKKSAA